MSTSTFLLTTYRNSDTFLLMSNPMSFRLSDTALTLLDRLCSALGLKRSGVLELALRELAKKHKVRE
jgi:predicted transcriptional regulator